MKGMIVLAALLVLVAARPAEAQQPTATSADAVRVLEEEILGPKGLVTALDSIGTAAAPELERALGQLAAALSGIALKIASDPELRGSAVRAAQGLVGVAQVVVAEQSAVLQEVLRTAAEEISALPVPPDSAAVRR